MFLDIFRRRPRIEYDIVPSPEGWRVSCGEVLGPPYASRSDATKDTLFVAARLRESGERVTVRVLEMDGPHKVWGTPELPDARLP